MAGKKLTRRAAAAAIAAAAITPPALADGEVDLLLVLAVDASGSVNQVRFDLQKKGYAEAFRDAQVLRAIKALRTSGIAVTMTQWTGPTMTVQVLPWTRINDEVSLVRFSTAIEGSHRHLFGGGTSVSGAIDQGVSLILQAPFKASRRVIDVSGDGANNRGRAASLARDDAIKADITVNGLPIMALEHDLDTYYRDNVIGGAGAFMIVADSYETFGSAVKRKLIQEISGLPAARLPA